MRIYKNTLEGNTMMVMASVRKMLMDTGRASEWPEVRGRMMTATHKNLCAIVKEVSNGSIDLLEWLN